MKWIGCESCWSVQLTIVFAAIDHHIHQGGLPSPSTSSSSCLSVGPLLVMNTNTKCLRIDDDAFVWLENIQHASIYLPVYARKRMKRNWNCVLNQNMNEAGKSKRLRRRRKRNEEVNTRKQPNSKLWERKTEQKEKWECTHSRRHHWAPSALVKYKQKINTKIMFYYID